MQHPPLNADADMCRSWEARGACRKWLETQHCSFAHPTTVLPAPDPPAEPKLAPRQAPATPELAPRQVLKRQVHKQQLIADAQVAQLQAANAHTAATAAQNDISQLVARAQALSSQAAWYMGAETTRELDSWQSNSTGNSTDRTAGSSMPCTPEMTPRTTQAKMNDLKVRDLIDELEAADEQDEGATGFEAKLLALCECQELQNQGYGTVLLNAKLGSKAALRLLTVADLCFLGIPLGHAKLLYRLIVQPTSSSMQPKRASKTCCQHALEHSNTSSGAAAVADNSNTTTESSTYIPAPILPAQSELGIYPTDSDMQQYKRQLGGWVAAIHNHAAAVSLLKVAGGGIDPHRAGLEGGLGGDIDLSICKALVTGGRLPMEVMLSLDRCKVSQGRGLELVCELFGAAASEAGKPTADPNQQRQQEWKQQEWRGLTFLSSSPKDFQSPFGSPKSRDEVSTWEGEDLEPVDV